MYYTKYTGPESVSIVNALVEIGENSSYANRKLIAAANGIADYSGTATQNLQLLSLLKDGLLIKPGTDTLPENTDQPTKRGFGRKVLIGALVLGAGIAAYKMFGNDEPKTATKKSAKKITKKSAKKNSRKGLNGVNCSYYTNESSGVSIKSDNRMEFKEMLKDYAAQHPDKKAGGVAFMRHKNGNEEIMYGFTMRGDGVVIFEPRIGNIKFLQDTKKSRKGLNGVGSYKVIAGMNINSKKYADYYNSDDYDQDEFIEKQFDAEEKELNRRGYSYWGDAYVIETSSGEVVINSIGDSIKGMAVKEGVNLVEFADGKIGYVGYYGGYTDWFKIIRKPTEKDEEDWEEDGKLTL